MSSVLSEATTPSEVLNVVSSVGDLDPVLEHTKARGSIAPAVLPQLGSLVRKSMKSCQSFVARDVFKRTARAESNGELRSAGSFGVKRNADRAWQKAEARIAEGHVGDPSGAE
jgi:hypothetical protein